MTKKPEFQQVLNKVKERLLFLSPTVKRGLERECDKGDFYRCGDNCIGKGGFGEVWKVNHKKTGDVYVIKVLDKKNLKAQNLISQLNLEIKIMYKVHHPHTMQLINHYEDDNNFFMIMPYASRGQLYTLLRKSTRFDQRTTAQFLRETISAVKYLHEHHVIHRDIKPENILLDHNFRVKLSDFGWSNFCEENEMRKTFCGTPEYLSPEMVKRLPHDYRVDIWSLGVLLFECLAGYPPFTGQTEEELFKNIRQLKIHWPIDFPPLAKNLVTKILKLNPKERPSLDEILKHSWFSHNPPLRPPLPNKFTNERKILESHLINVKPTNKEVKEKLDFLFPNINDTTQKDDDKNNEEEKNIDKDEKRKATIIKMKEMYNNLNQSFYFNDTINIGNIADDSKFVDAESVKKENKDKGINELKLEHEKEKEKLNREIINLNKRIKDLENEKNTYKNENMKLKEEISLNENKVKDIIEKEKIIEKERKELFDEIEQKSNNLLEFKSKYNEANTEKERLLKENNEKENKINELTKILEIKNNNINEDEKKIIKLQNEKKEIYNTYQKKINEMQDNLLQGSDLKENINNDSQKISSVLSLLEENIKDFKEIFIKKINNLEKNTELFNKTRVDNENNLVSLITTGYDTFNNLVNNSTNNIKENLIKIKNEIDNNESNNEKNKKKEMEKWYKTQIDELLVYKNKVLENETVIERLNNENNNLKEKIKLNENNTSLIKNKKNLEKTQIDVLEEKIDILHVKIEEIIKYVMAKFKEIHTINELNKFLTDFKNEFNNEKFLSDMANPQSPIPIFM